MSKFYVGQHIQLRRHTSISNAPRDFPQTLRRGRQGTVLRMEEDGKIIVRLKGIGGATFALSERTLEPASLLERLAWAADG